MSEPMTPEERLEQERKYYAPLMCVLFGHLSGASATHGPYYNAALMPDPLRVIVKETFESPPFCLATYEGGRWHIMDSLGGPAFETVQFLNMPALPVEGCTPV